MRRARFVGAVAQAHHPVGRVLLVVARLLHALPAIAASSASLDSRSRSHSSVNQVATSSVAQHGEREVAAGVRQLDDRQVAVVALVAQERELVLVVALAFELAARA